jgi:hypothetical protein
LASSSCRTASAASRRESRSALQKRQAALIEAVAEEDTAAIR